MRIGFAACILLLATMPSVAVREQPTEAASAEAQRKPQDGVRPEDVMIDSDIVGDVWDTVSPADTIGITSADIDILPAITSAISSAQLLQEKGLYRPPQPESTTPKRLPTQRWRPAVPIQTLFYLGLAIVIVAVLFLKARP